MNDLDFDRLAERLAQIRLSRRKTIMHGWHAGLSVGFLAIAGAPEGGVGRSMRSAPSAQSTPTSGAGAEDTNLCDQPYALCSSAPCEEPSEGATVTTCQCQVFDGYSIGYTTCEERAPDGNKLVSTFSTQDATTAGTHMTCPESGTWANCLDMPCEVDADDASKAVCQCQVLKSGPYITFGGDCDLETCSTVVWSAAKLNLPIVSIYETEMKKLGQHTSVPIACPSATPMASPAAT